MWGINRAVLNRPRVMVLDEATSALSSLHEMRIQSNFGSVYATRTTIAIAHRLSTVMTADDILVLDEGRAKERGKHEEFAKEEGLYASMCGAQEGGRWKIGAGVDEELMEER